eukprot:2933193-Pleurochrysis_carterae.AAC.2
MHLKLESAGDERSGSRGQKQLVLRHKVPVAVSSQCSAEKVDTLFATLLSLLYRPILSRVQVCLAAGQQCRLPRRSGGFGILHTLKLRPATILFA